MMIANSHKRKRQLSSKELSKLTPPWKQRLNDVGMRIMGRLGVAANAIAGHRAHAPVSILTYHRIAPHYPGFPEPHFNVTPDRFREQLTGLLRRGYSVWPLRHLLDAHHTGQTVPPGTLVVTFDDCFETVYTEAWPVLRELGIPATCFIATAFLDSNEAFPFDPWGKACQDRVPAAAYRPLRTEQCQEMADGGLIELGAHTHTHQDFRDRVKDFRSDMQTCLRTMQQRFGLDCMTFAFPYGSPRLGFAGGALTAAAKELGVLCSLTTEPASVDPAEDPFTWGRFNAFCWDTSTTLAAKLAGWYSWAPALKHRVLSSVSR